ncbi:MAG TPA: hypothetical protein VF613_21380 [Longimicrobium sp.]|jgi:hypothetical protein
MKPHPVDTTTRRPDLGFWEWWRTGVRAAGVREADLPELAFAADLGTAATGERTAGVFQVHHDGSRNRIYTSIRLREDLSSRVTLGVPFPKGSIPPDVFACTPAAAAGLSDAVLMLALQCANFEQFAWRYWETGRGPRAADREATRRAAALVRVWLAGSRPYRAPRYASGVTPVRYAGRAWKVEDGWLVADD